MLLPSALRARLAGAPGAAEPLPVERSPAARAAPFGFVPRPVRFPREHEFFEDGDVQRHLYLQDVITQVAEAPEKSRSWQKDKTCTSAWLKAAVRNSRIPRTGRITCPSMPGAIADLSTRTLADDGDAMEVCPSPMTLSSAPVSEKRTYSHRVPSTICFGQGALRGFKSTKKKNKHH
ncbi:PREDICTED: zinc finger protein 511 isoform X2 [Chinchilla lanigera]|uniref:zinc finger protein 511 isoform X2 n=1 Tax=Chinchilla lanigera TaxID=34839 RepID=UPI00069612D2|nr:PREDICTED: zinc finger protein 511 isoform X2 [Chinchilla lanigera]